MAEGGEVVRPDGRRRARARTHVGVFVERRHDPAVRVVEGPPERRRVEEIDRDGLRRVRQHRLGRGAHDGHAVPRAPLQRHVVAQHARRARPDGLAGRRADVRRGGGHEPTDDGGDAVAVHLVEGVDAHRHRHRSRAARHPGVRDVQRWGGPQPQDAVGRRRPGRAVQQVGRGDGVTAAQVPPQPAAGAVGAHHGLGAVAPAGVVGDEHGVAEVLHRGHGAAVLDGDHLVGRTGRDEQVAEHGARDEDVGAAEPRADGVPEIGDPQQRAGPGVGVREPDRLPGLGADGVGEPEDGQLPQRVRGQHGEVRVAVQGRVALEDVHGEALVGEEECRGETGDACAQHEQRYGNHGSPRSPERTRQG